MYIPKSNIPDDSMDNTGKIILKSILFNLMQDVAQTVIVQ